MRASRLFPDLTAQSAEEAANANVTYDGSVGTARIESIDKDVGINESGRVRRVPRESSHVIVRGQAARRPRGPVAAPSPRRNSPTARAATAMYREARACRSGLTDRRRVIRAHRRHESRIARRATWAA